MTKIVAVVDALGNLVHFNLIPGQNYDTAGVPPLLEPADFKALLADKAFDVEWIRDELAKQKAKAVIPQRKNRITKIPYNKHTYGARHLIENLFCKIKGLKRITMRSDKTDQSFTAMIHLAATVINSR